MRPPDIAARSFIFGSTESAFRYAEELWRTIPRPSPAEAAVLAKTFEAAFSGLSPSASDLESLNLRRPHFTACFNGVFGGGTTGFPGEFALAHYGVLLFAEVDNFKPEIIEELPVRLRGPVSAESPVVLIHATEPARLPPSLADLALPRVALA